MAILIENPGTEPLSPTNSMVETDSRRPTGRSSPSRKASFKKHGPKYRATKVNLPQGVGVAQLAAKFNAIVIDDHARSRAILRQSQVFGQASVKAAVEAFEGDSRPSDKVVVLKRTATKGPNSSRPTTLSSAKPKISPKPSSLVARASTLRKDKAMVSKLSVPKDQSVLEKVLESEETTDAISVPEPIVNKTEPTKNTSVKPNPSFLYKKLESVQESNEQTSPTEEAKSLQMTIDESDSSKSESSESLVKSIRSSLHTMLSANNTEPLKSEKSSGNDVPNNEDSPPKQLPEVSVKPVKSSLYNKILANNPINSKAEQIPDESTPKATKSTLSADEKSPKEDSQPPTTQLKANKSSLFKLHKDSSSLNQTEVPGSNEKPEPPSPGGLAPNTSSLYKPMHPIVKPKSDSAPELPTSPITSKSSLPVILTKDLPKPPQCPLPTPSSDPARCPSPQIYETINCNNYESVTYNSLENCYSDIYDVNKEPIYDDVNLKQGQYYESEANSYVQENSLYDGLRSPSEGSSGSGHGNHASRSDTSDDWVDLEPEPEQYGASQVVVLLERSRSRAGTNERWSECFRKHLISRQYQTGHDGEDSESDSSKHYENVDIPIDEDSAVCDDFDGSSESESSVDLPPVNSKEARRSIGKTQSDGISNFVKKVTKTSKSLGKSLRNIRKLSMPSNNINGDMNGVNNKESKSGTYGVTRRWNSFRKNSKMNMSTFYVSKEEFIRESPPLSHTTSNPDIRRLSMAIRPSSPPPPPPSLPARTTGSSNGTLPISDGKLSEKKSPKPLNDTTWYSEWGLFKQSSMSIGGRSTGSWYTDIGLYENSAVDGTSDAGSSQGSELNLRFPDEPLYQFYELKVNEREHNTEELTNPYEEIVDVLHSDLRPSALDMLPTLWGQLPQVINSGILDTLSHSERKLQETKFELMTSEASYYKSLMVLEKHFAANPLLKDENVLSKIDYKTLFSNVTPVRQCSEVLVKELDKCWQESILLEGACDVMLRLASNHLTPYINYCSNQVYIERTLKRLRETNSAFVEALRVLEYSPKCQSLSLYSFMMLPMQRITRLRLLCQAILSKLPDTHPEFRPAQAALAQIDEVVNKCNEAVRQTERSEELAAVASTLKFPASMKSLPLVSASRHLVHSGVLSQVSLEPKLTLSKKLTSRNTKLRFFLFNDYLVIAKKKSTTSMEETFTVVDYCNRGLVTVKSVDAVPGSSVILLTLLKNHEDKTIDMVLCCGTEVKRAEWMGLLSPPKSGSPSEVLHAPWCCPKVSALHSFTPTQADELELRQGDVINVHRESNGWYYGEKESDNTKGWFPGNHTTEIESVYVRAKNLLHRHQLLTSIPANTPRS